MTTIDTAQLDVVHGGISKSALLKDIVSTLKHSEFSKKALKGIAERVHDKAHYRISGALSVAPETDSGQSVARLLGYIH